MQNHFISAILVPQGSEYKSVCRGLRHSTTSTPSVFPIPVGVSPTTEYLKKLQQAGHLSSHSQPRVLLMGLCGSLTPRHNIGDIVLYKSCIYQSQDSPESLPACDTLTAWLHDKLQEKAALVQALTSDRLVYSAAEKRHLAQLHNAEVIDMEGFATLDVLKQAGIAVAMVRVISDDCQHNLPNLNSAISPDGSLLPLPLAIGMMRQPIAATRLIRGAIYGLRVLQDVTTRLFTQ